MRRRWTPVGRGLRYLLLMLPSGVLSAFIPFVLLAALMSVAAAGLGYVLVPAALAGVRRWANLHLRLAAALLDAPVPAHQPRPGKGTGGRLRRSLRDRTTWRNLAWVPVQVLTAIPAGALALFVVGGAVVVVGSALSWWAFPADAPLRLLNGTPVTGWGTALLLVAGQGVASVLAALLVIPPLAHAHARLTSRLLSPSERDRLAARVEELTETRAGALDAHGAELRRIERDLHDGTQAHLVSIAMRLGIAEQALADDPAAVAKVLQDARENAEDAMDELRDMIRTMYPPVLADRGLPGAVSALAARCAVPTTLDVGGLPPLPAAVEAAAYYVVAEALTNVTKHSDAATATVSLRHTGSRLRVVVADDGHGGADSTAGTGITGIHRRVAALDGTTRVHSPPGGPTSITVELPCGSS